MNWINFLWPMVTGACVTLGLINVRIGFMEKPRAARLLFALCAFAVAFLSTMELALMRSKTPAEFWAFVRWGDFATWLTLTSVTAFVWVFFGTGRKWLALAGPVLFGIGILLFDLNPGSSLIYREITGIKTLTTYGGATYQVAEGVPNPWNALAYLGVLFFLTFTTDASVRLWRRGRRPRAAIVGGSIIFFIVGSGVHSGLVEIGLVRTPYLISLFYLANLIAMGHELTKEVFAATTLGRQLRESEERMSLAAESARLSMWEWDVARDEVWMTDEGREMLGFPQDARIDFAALAGRAHPEDRPAREKQLRHALESDQLFETEYRVSLEDGTVRWIAARGRRAEGGAERTTKLLGVSMDITDQKVADGEAREQREALGHLSRVALVGEMATSLAHELNQPLTAMVTNASAAQRFLARENVNLGEVREALTDISEAGRRAGDVIRGIKDMVRKVESETSPLDVNELIAVALRLVRADALAHGCTLETELAPDLPVVVGDAVQLQQVLLNLILNAFDAMQQVPCDPCRVEISTRVTASGQVEMAVRDFGPGLPADGPLRIFERFFSTKREGMGMGLAIARSIIETHAGTLSAENAAGGGACFFIRLPAPVTAEREAMS